MSTNFTLPQGFPKVLLVVGAMNLHCWTMGVQAAIYRKKIFNKQFMDQHFKELHDGEVKTELPALGFPDSGNGPFYSSHLSYGDWFEFNVRQRLHQNYVEGINFATIAILSAGVVKANLGVGVGISYILGRTIYGFSYKLKGFNSKGRKLGSFLMHASILAGLAIFVKEYFIKK